MILCLRKQGKSEKMTVYIRQLRAACQHLLREFSSLQDENEEAVRKVDQSVKEHEKVIKSMNENHSRLEKKLVTLMVCYLDLQLLASQSQPMKLIDGRFEEINANVRTGLEGKVGARIADPKRREKSVGKGALGR